MIDSLRTMTYKIALIDLGFASPTRRQIPEIKEVRAQLKT
jgi:hypothetical protein